MYQDIRVHKFVFTVKPGVIKENLGSHEIIGKIVFKTKFKSNPFLFPLRAINSEAIKRISIAVPED